MSALNTYSLDEKFAIPLSKSDSKFFTNKKANTQKLHHLIEVKKFLNDLENDQDEIYSRIQTLIGNTYTCSSKSYYDKSEKLTQDFETFPLELFGNPNSTILSEQELHSIQSKISSSTSLQIQAIIENSLSRIEEEIGLRKEIQKSHEEKPFVFDETAEDSTSKKIKEWKEDSASKKKAWEEITRNQEKTPGVSKIEPSILSFYEASVLAKQNIKKQLERFDEKYPKDLLHCNNFEIAQQRGKTMHLYRDALSFLENTKKVGFENGEEAIQKYNNYVKEINLSENLLYQLLRNEKENITAAQKLQNEREEEKRSTKNKVLTSPQSIFSKAKTFAKKRIQETKESTKNVVNNTISSFSNMFKRRKRAF